MKGISQRSSSAWRLGGYLGLTAGTARGFAVGAAIAVPTALLAAWAIDVTLTRTGGIPAVPLDDAYIHFQYARSFAEGRPFEYTPGSAPAPGASSVLWALLLGIFYALGVEGAALVWPAWLLGWACLALLGWEVLASTRGLLDVRTRWTALAAVLSCGGFAWAAGSGMAVIPLGLLLLRTARRCAEWFEAPAAVVGYPSTARRGELVALAFAGPLVRPEGALATLLVAVTLFGRPGTMRRWPAMGVLTAIGLPPLINLTFTGEAASTTLEAKWLFARPYPTEIPERILEHLELLFGVLLSGEEWARYLVPDGPAIIAWLAIPALLMLGVRTRRLPRATLLALVGLGILIPATYHSFLWNRLRYLWPFASVWLVGAVALGDLAALLGSRWWPPLRRMGFLWGLVVVYACLRTLPESIEDLAESSDAIRRQQVALGKWASRELPRGSVIGVNDAGAIAYFSGHKTFDLVGLTTLGEARYWSSGAGSRFEHYEELGAAALPDYLIVYPGWWQMPELLGERLAQRRVNASILGGTTMVAHEADYSLLGSATRPQWSMGAGTLLDELDVAHLDQEESHGYQLLDASQATNHLIVVGTLADGARSGRTLEKFRLVVQPGGTLVARLASETRLTLTVSIGALPQQLSMAPSRWHELAIRIPSDARRGISDVTLTGTAPFTSMHYWSYSRPAPRESGGP